MSSSTTSSSSHPPPVTQKVFSPGVSKARKATTIPAAPKKRSVPNSQVAKKKGIKIDDLVGMNLSVDSIYWMMPAPGYRNPLNLNSIPENTGKLFTKWLSWESVDCIGYTLYNKNKAKYWADAVSIHMLSQAKLAGIDYNFFNFVVYRDGKGFKYSFMPRDYIPDDKLQSFHRFRIETETKVKKEEETEPKVNNNNNNNNIAAATVTEEEESMESINLTNLD